jgi:transposase
MSKSDHTEAQMIGALKQLEVGRKAEDVAREVGVSKHTIYARKAKYGGMDVSEAQEAKQLRDENTRPKKAGGGSKSGQGDAEGGDCKKRVELVDQRADADWLRSEYAASQRRVWGLMGMAVASYRYRTTRSDEPLRTHLVELAREKPRFGYRRLHVLLGRWGEQVNHKRVHRVYREAGLMLRRKKRKHCEREGKPLLARTAANQEWALDFVHDAVECGRAIRMLSVVDAYTRSGHQFRQPESDTGARCHHRRTGKAGGDPLRQRSGSSPAGIFWPGVWSGGSGGWVEFRHYPCRVNTEKGKSPGSEPGLAVCFDYFRHLSRFKSGRRFESRIAL